MNRRNFISNLLTATAGFTILPGAGRVWVARREPLESELSLLHYTSFDVGLRIIHEGDVFKMWIDDNGEVCSQNLGRLFKP